ncbi:MAG: response regulator [Candidatus Hydrogenedentes bacterium]|nr:response regulator [Candidatus Hydrogenedentota bacterium]
MNEPQYDVQRVRERLVNYTLYTGAIVGLPIFLLTTARAADPFSVQRLPVDLAIMVSAWIILLLGKRVPYRARAAFLLGVVFLSALNQIYTQGLYGFGPAAFLSLSAMAAGLLGMRMAFAMTAAGAATMLLAGWAATEGWLSYPADMQQQHLSFNSWFQQALGIVFYGAVIAIILGSIHRTLANSVAELTRRSRMLEESNLQLEREIAERLKAEEALKLSEEKLSSALHSSPDSIFVIAMDGLRIREVNDAALKQFGGDRSAVLEAVFPALWEWEPAEEAARFFHALKEHGSVHSYEAQARCDSLGRRMLSISAEIYAVREEKHAVIVVRDITQRLELEERLRQSQKMQAVGQLAGGVAHDFNNLLQVIRGYLEITLDEPSLDPVLRGNLQEVDRAANSATALVRQLLTFSRRQQLQAMPLNVNTLLTHLLTLIRRTIGEHIELSTVIAGNGLTILADQQQVEQVVINLCVNARDAMREGGRIHIATTSHEFDAAYCMTHPWAREGAFVEIAVSDDGPGIPPEVLEHVFEPFFTTKPAGQGTGLGLATVYAVVERHHGFVHLDTVLGKGTTVQVFLPQVTIAIAPRLTFEAGAKVNLSGATILVAEDESDILKLMLHILESEGCKVTTATNGKEAELAFLSHAGSFDLAILDVIMPKKSGAAVYQSIRERKPRLPVLFCSGYDFGSLGEEIENDPYAFRVSKPFTRNDFLAATAAMLNLGRA